MTSLQELILKSSDPLQAVLNLGKALAESQMFGARNPGQGVMIVTHCMDKGIALLDWAAEYHLVEAGGKMLPTMKADAMLARFQREGGSFIWVKDGSDQVEAVLTLRMGDREQTVRYTTEDAKRAGLIRADKPASAWNASRPAMLRARAASSGLRMFSPNTISGVYTPDELGGETTVNDAVDLSDAPHSQAQQATQQDATASTDKPKRGRPAKAKSEESGAADGAGTAAGQDVNTAVSQTTATTAAPVVEVTTQSTPQQQTTSPPTPVVTPSADTAKPAVDEARFAQVQWIERMKAKFFALTPDVLKGMGVPDDKINGITLNDQKWKPIETGAGTSVIAEMKQDDLNGLEVLLKTRLERLRPFEDSKDLEAFADRLAQGK